MANIRTKRDIKREAALDERAEHQRRCGVNAKNTFDEHGDVFRCKHGVIYYATYKRSYYGWEFMTLNRWRHPILYERALRALAEEARDAEAD